MSNPSDAGKPNSLDFIRDVADVRTDVPDRPAPVGIHQTPGDDRFKAVRMDAFGHGRMMNQPGEPASLDLERGKGE